MKAPKRIISIILSTTVLSSNVIYALPQEQTIDPDKIQDVTNEQLPTLGESTVTASQDIVLSEDQLIEMFPDESFRNSVKDEFYGEVTLNKVESLQNLNISNRNILDISGIEYFINLQYLDVSYNYLTDITLINQLKNNGVEVNYKNNFIDGESNQSQLNWNRSGIRMNISEEVDVYDFIVRTNTNEFGQEDEGINLSKEHFDITVYDPEMVSVEGTSIYANYVGYTYVKIKIKNSNGTLAENTINVEVADDDTSIVLSEESLVRMFPDENFREYIKDELGERLTLREIATKDTLWPGGMYDIKSIEGIELFKNLRSFGIYDTNISNEELNRLKDLTKLENLGLGSNNLKEVPSVIQYLPNLTSIDLSYNNIIRLPEIQPLSSLTSISLHDNAITDLPNWISQYDGHIDLENNYISDASSLDNQWLYNNFVEGFEYQAKLELKINNIDIGSNEEIDLYDYINKYIHSTEYEDDYYYYEKVKLPREYFEVIPSDSNAISINGTKIKGLKQGNGSIEVRIKNSKGELSKDTIEFQVIDNYSYLQKNIEESQDVYNYIINVPKELISNKLKIDLNNALINAKKIKSTSSEEELQVAFKNLNLAFEEVNKIMELNLDDEKLSIMFPDDNFRSAIIGNIYGEVTLNNIRNTTELYLYYNEISNIEGISLFINLEYLDLQGNNISSVPSEISKLSKLVSLDLSYNKFDEFPSEIINIKSLDGLFLNGNNLNNIPKEISNLQNLSYLYLAENNLSELPEEMGSLSKLTSLFIESNKFTNIPSFISIMDNLSEFFAGNNYISDINSVVTEKLEEFSLWGNLINNEYWGNKKIVLPEEEFDIQVNDSMDIYEYIYFEYKDIDEYIEYRELSKEDFTVTSSNNNIIKVNGTTIEALSPGKASIEIKIKNSSGDLAKAKANITVTNNLASKIYIDAPYGNINNGNIEVKGWALNGSGIRAVKIYVDDEYVGDAETGLERLDVDTAFPGYPGGENSGYKYNINKDTLKPGKHTIKIEALGRNNTKQISETTIEMKKLENITYIDSSYGNINDGNVEIKGWALNGSGIEAVKVYVDGEYIGDAETGLERLDVDAAFPGYFGGKNSGYKYTIDKDEFTPGKHTIKVEAIGSDSSKKISETIIDMKKLENKLWIDSPNGNINDDNVEVKGWALNTSGVKDVKIYVDGEYVGDAETGLERLDVNAAFPGYPGGETSGYKHTIDKDKFSLGKHTIKVEAVGQNNKKQVSETIVEMKKLENITYIDSPNGNINNDNVEVKGWALNGSGVKEIKIYVDGEYRGNAITGLERLDVNAAFPGYVKGKNSGYKYVIDKEKLKPGKHTIKVEAIGRDKSKKISETVIEMKKLENKLWIDSPSGDINNNLEIKGWALNGSGVKEVEIYVDGAHMGDAEIGFERLDVNAAFPGYSGGKNSGFKFELDKEFITGGKHTIKIRVVGEDGSIQTEEKEINMVKKNNLMNVDAPLSGSIRNKDIEISGWALNGSGISYVDIYLDNKYIDSAEKGIKRPDVNAVFPGYEDGIDSGFRYNIDKDEVSPGKHTVKVIAVGNDGSRQFIEREIEMVKLENKIYIDTPSESVKHGNIEVKGWALNSSGIDKVKVYLNGEMIGFAEVELERIDVKKAFPEYEYGENSGYIYEIPKEYILPGINTIKVVAIGNDKTTQSSYKTIKVNK